MLCVHCASRATAASHGTSHSTRAGCARAHVLICSRAHVLDFVALRLAWIWGVDASIELGGGMPVTKTKNGVKIPIARIFFAIMAPKPPHSPCSNS